MKKYLSKKISIVKTRYGVFSAIFESEPDMGGYMVTVPKIPDAITWGKTLAHAKLMATEAIECSIEGDVLITAEKEGVIVINKHQQSVA